MLKADKQQALNLEMVRRWNSAHGVGCAVTVKKDDGEIVAARTRTPAFIPSRQFAEVAHVPEGTALIWLVDVDVTKVCLLSKVRAKGETNA